MCSQARIFELRSHLGLLLSAWPLGGWVVVAVGDYMGP